MPGLLAIEGNQLPLSKLDEVIKIGPFGYFALSLAAYGSGGQPCHRSAQ